MSKSKVKPPIAIAPSSTIESKNKKSYLIMYFFGVVALLAACVGFYLHVVSAASPPHSKTTSHAACGNKDLWRASVPSAVGRSNETSGDVPLKPAAWGSLRPGIYFGMKTKSVPSFLSTGILWAEGGSQLTRNFRHAVRTDEIDHFEWLRNNGRTFGIEQLRDSKASVVFNATFVIESDTSPDIDADSEVKWHQHFLVKRPSSTDAPSRLPFIHYFGMDCDAADDQPLCFTPGRDMRDVQVQLQESAAVGEPTVVIVTGFSSLSGWFSLTYTATDISSTVGQHTPLDVSFYGPKAKRKRGNSGIPKTVDKILRAGELLRAASTSSARVPPPASDHGVMFDDRGMLSNTVESNAVGVFVQFLSSAPLDIHVTYASNLQWNSKEDALQSTSASPPPHFFAIVQGLVQDFDQQFQQRFGLAAGDNEGFSARHVEAARRGLSALLGGLGFFHGAPVTGHSADYDPPASAVTESDVSTPRSPNLLTLFSGTPSRSSFPRGFLWDEGFHQMLMSNWDANLTMEVLASWMSCMFRPAEGEVEEGQCRGGWIPRELILGQEAFKVVPAEFVTQRVDIANPPTLLIVVEKLLQRLRRGLTQCEAGLEGGYCAANSPEDSQFQKDFLNFLQDSFVSLHDWVQWFVDSQGADSSDAGAAAAATSFRWRGRSASADSGRLAPNTLASGLDDYPRSQYPSADERHVDLLSWVALSARIMQQVCAAVAEAESLHGVHLSPAFVSEVNRIKNDYYSDSIYSKYMDNLVALHWSVKDNMFYDVGLVGANERIDEGVMVRCSQGRRGGGTKDVLVDLGRLQTSRGREPSLCPSEFPQYMFPLGNGQGGLQTGSTFSSSSPRAVGFIRRLGYVNLFPLLLKLLPASSPQLEPLLTLLDSPRGGLLGAHGLRSLSQEDLFYQQENAPGDAPYWRGPIWMPINYLALGALKHYSDLPGCPHAARAGVLYSTLRRRIIDTVLNEYDSTGHFWEIYDDSTGRGMRGHPFAGWTTLVVNIMAELY